MSTSLDPHEQIAKLVLDSTSGTLAGPEQIVEAFYPELRRLAAAKMRHVAPGHTWQPTALVSELYLELVRMKSLRPVRPDDQQGKLAFFALAAQAMHWLLVRHTRPLSKQARKEELSWSLADAAATGFDSITKIDDLLTGLEQFDPELRAVVEMRVFEGLSLEETAMRLGRSSRTVTRHWQFAKAWLEERLA
jgi:RNA polymerase sigma factor (TIGR02999 family)